MAKRAHYEQGCMAGRDLREVGKGVLMGVIYSIAAAATAAATLPCWKRRQGYYDKEDANYEREIDRCKGH